MQYPTSWWSETGTGEAQMPDAHPAASRIERRGTVRARKQRKRAGRARRKATRRPEGFEGRFGHQARTHARGGRAPVVDRRPGSRCFRRRALWHRRRKVGFCPNESAISRKSSCNSARAGSHESRAVRLSLPFPPAGGGFRIVVYPVRKDLAGTMR